MKIGGGGWMTGLDIHPTEKGLMYARTDVSGAYRWDAASSSWKQIVTAASLPAEYVGYGRYLGVDSLVGAPKDPDLAYLAYGGQIFRSTDRGDHWTGTSFATQKVKMEPNGEGRQEGERLGVDPQNSDVVYFCSVSDGLWRSEDAGKNWQRVEGVPAGAAPHGVNTVVFDPGAGLAGSKTKVIYVTVDQRGVFRSEDGGAKWTNLAEAGPKPAAKIRDAAIGSDRTYYIAVDNEQNAVGSVWKLSPEGQWTNITPTGAEGGSKAYWDVAVDPTDARHVVVIASGGKCFVSKDQGQTWTNHGFKLNSSNIRWLGTQTNYWLSVGEIEFDPTGKLWFAEGFGIWNATDLTPGEIPWQAASEGIEEVCGNDVIAPPGQPPVGAMWDASTFRFSTPDQYNAQRGYANFMSAWALDWTPADPKFLVGVFRNHLGFEPQPNSSGFSTDGGVTWKVFPALKNKTASPELEYGIIAVSANSPDKIVWVPAQKKLPYFTSDRGTTWKQASLGGVTATGFDSFPTAQKPLCADRVLADTFYYYHSDQGVFRSEDGGATFAKVGDAVKNRYNAILKATPGHAKDLWFAEGSQGAPVGGIWRSKDGGATWTAAPFIAQAFNFGLGKSKTEGGYPTIYVAGVAEGKTGIYRSTDEGATWDRIGTYPLGIFDWIDGMDADKDVFGKVYLGFTSAGFAYGAEKR